MNKRGMSYRAWIKLLLIAVLALGLFSLGVAFVDFTTDEGAIERCRFSIFINSKVHEGTELSGVALVQDVEIPIDCPAHEIEVKAKNITEQVRQVGEELRSCWYKMGEGNFKVFGTEYFKSLIGTDKKGAICVVCSTIKSQDNLPSNIVNTYLKKEIPGKSVSYAQYVGVETNPSSLFYNYEGEKLRSSGVAMNKNRDYLAVFYRVDESYKNYFFDNLIDASHKEEQGIMIIPQEDLAKSKICKSVFWKRE